MTQTGKVAIVTGASRGIGAGLVRAYLDAGYAVIANSRSLRSSSDPRVLTITGDVGDPMVGESLVREAVDRFGRVDTLINNAGASTPKPFLDYTAEDWSQALSTNLTGFFHVTQAAVRQMLAQGDGGHIVQVSTSMADQPIAKLPALLTSLTKAGLNAATRSLALEYASVGIRVNAVALGIIDTPMHKAERHVALAATHPLGRIGSVAEVVDAILYLERSTFTTGVILAVDGGRSAGRW